MGYKKKTKYRNVIDTSVVVTIAQEHILDVSLVTEAGVRFSVSWKRFHEEYRKVQ
ncbi:hypothetical protein VPHD51_0115 [Vibrio phage D51]